MLHFLLLAVFTAGVATLTFALMALASMASVGYRSSALCLSKGGAAPVSGVSSSPR